MNTPPAVLSVQSAIHGEIRLQLSEALVVGRAISADVVVADRSVAPLHLKLTAATEVHVEALEDDVVFGDQDHLVPGQRRTLRQTTFFRIGDLPCCVEMETLPERRAVSHRGYLLPAMLAVVLAGFAVFAMSSRTSASPPASTTALIQKTGPIEAGAVVDLSSILAELKIRGLDAITLERLTDGSLRATGAIDETARERWYDAKRSADASLGGQTVLIDNVTVGIKAPALSIQSAWLGDIPYIINGDGEKMFAGAMLADGWTIEGIEPGSVSIRRLGQRVAIRF